MSATSNGPKPLKLFWVTVDGADYAFSREMFDDLKADVDSGEFDEIESGPPGEDGKPKVEKKPILRKQTDAELTEELDPESNGNWHEVHVKKPVFGDELDAEAIATKAGPNNTFKREAKDMPGARIQTMVTYWTIEEFEPTMESFPSMPTLVGGLIYDWVMSKMYPTAYSHPAFSKRYGNKQTGS